MIRRKNFLVVLAAAALFPWPAHTMAQDFPSKPIRLIVPFTPGGSNDVLARLIAEKLSPALGQPVIVENKPGASGNIGADMVAKAAPDGHTLLIAANNIMAMNPSMFSKMPFDSEKDFAPITLLATVPVVLVVGPALQVSSIKDLVTMARQKPGALDYASSGVGSPQHLSAELFKSMTQTDITHIPYKGAAPAINDLLGGQVRMQFGASNSLLPHIRSGKLKAIGVAGAERIPSMPDVPTIAESGVPGYESDIWVGLVAPARTPAPVIDRINREVRTIMQLPDVRERLSEQGIASKTSSPADMSRLIASDSRRWAQIIKAAGIKAD